MKKYVFVNFGLLLIFLSFLMLNNYVEKNRFFKYENSFNKTLTNLYNNNLSKENKLLKEILDLNSSNDFLITSSYFSSLYDEIVINKGCRENIRVGAAVLGEVGLVGIVRNVKENYSTVELLENINSKLSVKINDYYGILIKDKNELVVTGILSSNMNIGDKVYTSGLTNIPENIYVGIVKEIVNKDDVFETLAIISLDNNYKFSKYLMVAL